MPEVKKLEKELTAVVKQMTLCQTVDDIYFGLMRRERELKELLYNQHENEPPKNEDGAYRLWKEWEVKLIRKHYLTTDAEALAKVIGVTRMAVYHKAHAIGLRKKKK